LGLPKEGRFGEEKGFLEFWERKRNCKYFVVENHRFCFDISKIFVVGLISKFSTKHGFML